MPEHYQILDKLLELGRTDVQIRYSTNFSRFKFGKKHVFDYWRHFKNLQVWISVDGIGKVGEYVSSLKYTTIFSMYLLVVERLLTPCQVW